MIYALPASIQVNVASLTGFGTPLVERVPLRGELIKMLAA